MAHHVPSDHHRRRRLLHDQQTSQEKSELDAHQVKVASEVVVIGRPSVLSPKTEENDNEMERSESSSTTVVVLENQLSLNRSTKKEEEQEKKVAPLGPVPEEAAGKGAASTCSEDNGRERLKRHRIEMAGRVWIPEIWGQEDLLKDWIDCSAFDACLVPNGIMSARASLVQEGRRATSRGLGIENRC